MPEINFAERPEGGMTMAADMVHATNYYRWIAAQFTPYFGNRILDVGGGYGSHLEYILPEHDHVTSVELSDKDVQFLQERFKAYPNFRALRFDFGADNIDVLVAEQFDTITCFNVLEHIKDDGQALKQMYTILAAQEGHLLLQVPAHQWLYGSLDHQAGHYRRYSLKGLRQVLREAGFAIKAIYYFNSFGVLPWYINARILKRTIESESVGLQIRIFDNLVVPIFRRVERTVRLPVGQSVIAVAQAVTK